MGLVTSAITAELWWDALECCIDDILPGHIIASPLCQLLQEISPMNGTNSSANYDMVAIGSGAVEHHGAIQAAKLSIVKQSIGPCKTEASQKTIPLDPRLAGTAWRQR